MSRSFRNNSRSIPNYTKRESVERVRFQENISQAETSEDEHGVKITNLRGRSTERKDNYSNYKKDKKDDSRRQQSHSHSRSPAKFDNSQSSTTRISSHVRNSSTSFNNTQKSKTPNKDENPTYDKKPSFCPFPPPPTRSSNQHDTITLEDDNNTKDNITQIMNKINSINCCQSSNYWTLKHEFFKLCSHHVRILGKIPQALTSIGQQLLKNGLFHSKWIQIVKKQQNIDLKSLFESYYVLFRQKIKNNVQDFQRMLNVSKDCQKVKQSKRIFERQSESNVQLKRYRSLIDEQQQQHYQRNHKQSSLSTTKLDTMLLYQQLKQQLRMQQMQQQITKNVQKTIQQWKLKTLQLQKSKHEHFLPICDADLMFETQQSTLQKWNDFQQLQKRKQAIEQLEKQRVRQRSPLSNRFRMMHQCQTNSRRMQVQMACMFLNCESFYYMQDLEILNVEETIFSETQEIVVLKAYAVEFDPKVGMMKLEPKIKTLISVYKFCGLSELIRLQKTYGKFDGIVVYPQSFDIQKYLTSNKELSLVNEKFLRQVKGQVSLNEVNEQNVERQGEKIEY